MDALTWRCQGYHCHCRVSSLNQSEMHAASANYGSDTALANSTCEQVASIGDRLACSLITAILIADRVLALDTTGFFCNSHARDRTPRDPGPHKHPPKKGISTAPVTAIGFASIDVEIRTELENRVLCALQGKPL
jgi:hypothetical protein